ncbi:AAA family ATPase [Ideonella sp. DXS29W]|uniref:AAA family ATPase n=1 Tax=Ideonella lacteola TaxID=2984193 RepID=A0ABU9BKN7_9BURK
MALVSYPLFCWQLDDDSVFGVLLGTGLEAVERNAKRLKSAMAETLHRERERDRYVPDPEVDDAHLRIVKVQVHLAHRTDKGSFPLPSPTEIAVAAVHGAKPSEGYFKCWLPWLDESFYYYEEAQLPALIQHYTRDRLDGMSPEEAQRYVTRGTPWLETVESRRDDRIVKRQGLPRHVREAHEQLAIVADRLPEAGARRPAHGMPEAAWEQGALVDDIATRLAAGSNLLLVGEVGVGKSVVIAEAIRRAHRQTSSREVAPTFWRSNSERLIGRAKYLGEWQALCDQVQQWLEASNGVLWVTDFLNLLQVGGEGPEESMASYLLPALRRGSLRLIGEARPEEMEAARRQLPAFVDCFEPLLLPEMDGARARRVLDLLAAQSKSAWSVDIEPNALDAGYRLLSRHVRYERFPGKAVRFFGECVREAIADRVSAITTDSVLGHFARFTGLPEHFLRDDQPLDDAEVQAYFAGRLFGQDEAIRHLKEVVYLFKSGLNDPGKPIATLLFAGPTGVGKTAAAKALAGYFYGAQSGVDPLFRIDMSEFQHAFQIARLIGTGRRPGRLVEHVRQRPFSVVLLDEIEKADPSVFDMLLGVLDEGRLRDSQGRITDFRGSLIVMTTNLGVRQGSAAGFAPESEVGDATHEIRQFFRPEFFNRIDRLVHFAPLGAESIASIAQHELQALAEREGLKRRRLALRFSPELVGFVARAGFSPRYGARPLQRAVEHHVVAAVGRALLGDVRDGALIELDFVDGTVQVRVSDGSVSPPRGP